MKRDINKKLLYIITLSIFVLIPFIKYFSIFLYLKKYLENYNSINAVIILYISVPLLIYIYIRVLKKNKFKLDFYDYLLFSITFIGIIVSLFSIDMYTSFFGLSTRSNGFITLFCYCLLFINWKKVGTYEDLRFFYKLIVYIALFNVTYSLLQIYSNYEFVLRTSTYMTASGFCGHNNFFGSLIVIALSMVSCKFLIEDKLRIKTMALISFLFIGLINSQSTGPFLGYILSILFSMILLKLKNSLILKKGIIIILILILTFMGINSINRYVFNSEKCELCDIKKNSIDNGGNDRLHIWGNTFKVIKKYPIFGVGYDNLTYAYPQHYSNVIVDPSGVKIDYSKSNEVNYFIVDNAHNVYLQTLVSSGIIGLIPYLLLCLFTFIKGCKSKNNLKLIFLSGFVGYSIQAFFNISVITVAPIYYLIIGLILIEEPNE